MANGQKLPPKQNAGQQAQGLAKRLDALEQNFIKFLTGANQRLDAVNQRLSIAEEKLDGVITLNGVEDVTRVINELRVERAREEAEAEKASLEQSVKDGYVFPVDAIGEKSMVVCRHIDKDGNIAEPGRLQLIAPKFTPEFKAIALGQPAGSKLPMPNGNGVLEILEIYNTDDEKYKAFVAERQAKAQEAMRAQAQAAIEAAQAKAAAAAAPQAQE